MKLAQSGYVLFAVVLACLCSWNLLADETALREAREKLDHATRREYASVKTDEWTAKFMKNLPKQVVEMIETEKCADNVQAFFDVAPKGDKEALYREQKEKLSKVVWSKQNRNTAIGVTLRKKYPLCKVGMKVSVTTRSGVITGTVRRITKDGVRLDSRFVPKVDMTPESWACFEPIANDIMIEKERRAILKAEKKEFNEMLKEELRQCLPKIMLDNGYLPKVDDRGRCNFQSIKVDDWGTRKEFLDSFIEWSRMSVVQQRTAAQQAEVQALEKQLEQEKKAQEKAKKQAEQSKAQTKNACPICNGTGHVRGKSPKLITETMRQPFSPVGTVLVCPHCNGKGYK